MTNIPNSSGQSSNIKSATEPPSPRKIPIERPVGLHPNLQHRLPDASDLHQAEDYLHPLAVMCFRHLMNHMGFWVVVLFGAQAWFSSLIGVLLRGYLPGGPIIYSAIMLALMLLLDWAVWLQLRGKLIDAFLVPFVVLFLMAALPIVILFVK